MRVGSTFAAVDADGKVIATGKYPRDHKEWSSFSYGRLMLMCGEAEDAYAADPSATLAYRYDLRRNVMIVPAFGPYGYQIDKNDITRTTA